MKTYPINCTPVECIKRRYEHTPEELAWAKEVMEIYGCYPINKKNVENTQQFIMDVFHAGRISGIRLKRSWR